jgi:tetratricopeptide (TPR) repeat protein
MDCLGDSTIAAYVDGELDRDAIGRVDRHIDGCESCRGQLSAVAVAPVLRSFVATDTVAVSRAPTEVAAGTYPGTAAGSADPEPGSALGRYVVDAVIGRGGMGVVVRAYDPELDRRIAIKLVDPAAGAGGGWRAGLRAEAQAMARLRHPNVVAVHDVGSVGDRVFVAMELVDGASLGRWRAGRDRRDALAACVAAGRGLVAAHAAGVIHGDVKPDNILVDGDGRAMIADFGLARAIAAAGEGAGSRRLCGTPAYMAPELFAGEPADVRSDQFAFAVTVYECVVGTRPWRGDSFDDLRVAIEAGPPPRPAAVPVALWAVIARGLAIDPAARHPTLAAFVDALAAHAGGRRRRGWIAAGAGAVLTGGVALAIAARPAPGVACADPDVRTAELARIPATLCPAGETSFCGRLARGLGGWVKEWRATHRGVCRAARDGTGQATVDARMRCLDHALRGYEAFVAELAPPPLGSPDALAALSAFAGVGSPGRCATADPDRYPVPPADRAAAIAEIEQVWAAANADFAFGRHAAGLAALTPHQATVQALGHPLLAAQFEQLLGHFQRDLGQLDAAEASYDRSLRAAAEAGSDTITATVLLDLVHLVVVLRDDATRGDELMRAAAAAIIRAGSRPELESRYQIMHGVIAERRGDFTTAAADYGRAIEAREKLGDPAETALARIRLCGAEVQLGTLADARAHCTEALAVLREQLGDDHPVTADAESQLAIVHATEGDLVKAREHWRAALAAFERSVGPTSPYVANMAINLALIATELGDHEDAKRQLDRARSIARDGGDAISEIMIELQVARQHRAAGRLVDAIAVLAELSRRAAAVLGNHPLTGDVHRELGTAYYKAGRMRDARAAFELAVATNAAVFGDRHLVTLTTQVLYGQALMALDEDRAACTLLEKVQFVTADVAAADSPYLADAYTNLARCLLELGEHGRAADVADKGFAIRAARADDPLKLAEARFVLGRALWRARRDRPRAVELVTAAAEEMRAIGREQTSLTAAERWLAGKR